MKEFFFICALIFCTRATYWRNVNEGICNEWRVYAKGKKEERRKFFFSDHHEMSTEVPKCEEAKNAIRS